MKNAVVFLKGSQEKNENVVSFSSDYYVHWL